MSSCPNTPIRVGEESLKHTHEIFPRQQLCYSADRSAAITTGGVTLVNLLRQTFLCLKVPGCRLRTTNKSGASAPGNFPALKQPTRSIGIGGHPRWIAAHSAVDLLNHERIRKAHWPFDAVYSECQGRGVRAARGDKGDAIEGAGDMSQKFVYADVTETRCLCVQPKVVLAEQQSRSWRGGVWLRQVQI